MNSFLNLEFVFKLVIVAVFGFMLGYYDTRLRKALHNPQNIVYVGLVVLAIGITVAAIDPLKPEPVLEPIYMELELDNPGDYYIDAERPMPPYVDYETVITDEVEESYGTIIAGNPIRFVIQTDELPKYAIIEVYEPNGDMYRTYRLSPAFVMEQNHYTTAFDEEGIWKFQSHMIMENGEDRVITNYMKIITPPEHIVKTTVSPFAGKMFMNMFLYLVLFAWAITLIIFAFYDRIYPKPMEKTLE